MAIKCLLPPRDKEGKANRQAMSFARLFTDEIEDYLKLNFVNCYNFEKFFKADVFEELVNRESLPLEAARKATTDDEAYEIMDRLLIVDDVDLWTKIHLPEVPESSSFEVFTKRFFEVSGNFLVLDRVAAVLEVNETLLERMCPGQKYPTLRAAASNGPQIQAKVARRFLRELPLLQGKGEEWFWSLIEACTQDAHNISSTLGYLLPNWKTELAAYRSSVSSSSHSFNSLQRVLVPGVSCRPPAEFEPYRDEMTVAGTAVMPSLREYQKELVERTDRGENTIVCAPTVHIVGRHDGEIFMEERQIQFMLGSGSEHKLPEGVDKALRRFTAGEYSRIIVNGTQNTYGTSPPEEFNLPANAELQFNIFLKEFDKACAAAYLAKKPDPMLLLAQKKYLLMEEMLDCEGGAETADEKKERDALLLDTFRYVANVARPLKDQLKCVQYCDKVVMIVPKVFLVDQQAKLFKDYTKKEFCVAKLSGDTNETGEAQLIKFLSGDIVVLTPQILVNMLREESEKARLYVADITLLLLDECHHADKKNPYNLIMQSVKEASPGGPQVVGLTASLGVGDGGSAGGIIVEDQAFNHIVRTCLRMAAHSVTTIMRNKAELASYVQLPEDVLRRVLPMPVDERFFHSHLLTAISFVERHLYAEFDALIAEQPSGINFDLLVRFPPIEKFEEYTAAVVNVDTELRKLKDGDRKWRLKRGIDFVKMYHNAILLNDLLPASYALEQLLSDVTELDSAPLGRSCVFLDHFNQHKSGFHARVESENDKEILQELRKELSNQFRALPDSRVLIFCLKRETSQLLAKYLNEMNIQGMGRAEVLTSTNAAAVKNGQSNSEQRAVIESFTRGACKVIVATSVAEEGLDVKECNLIIKYNIAGNVIARVQQRGRARASNSRSVLLALDEKVFLKENKNKMAEDVMMRTVAKIYDMGDVEFRKAIEKERIIQVKQEQADEKEQEKRQAKKYRELSLLCEKCNKLLCSSKTLRVMSNNYISVDSSLWRKVRVQAKKGETYNNIASAGVVQCLCERVLGQVIKIQGQFVPTLKAEAILFQTIDGTKDLSKMKKWKGIATNHLDIREGTALEVTAMNRALQSSNETLSRALENLSLL